MSAETITLAAYCIAIIFASLLGGWLPSRIRMTHTRTQVVMSLVAGLMLGVEFDRSLKGFAGEVSKECEANGLLALTAGVHEACRLIPPLIVNDEDLDEGLAIFADAVGFDFFTSSFS